jgi:hypothetical protein
MDKRLLFILFCFLTLTSCSQDYSVKEIVEFNPHFPDDEYIFPILDGPNKKITQEINSHLVKDQLSIEFGNEETSIFENVWQQPDAPFAQINYLTYKVELLNDKLYTVTISGEFCSAYCEGYDMTYTFDLSSGKLLNLDTLFNKIGQEQLLNELIGFKSKKIKEKVEKLKQLTKSDTLDKDHLELYENMLELYSYCNSEYADLKDFRFIPTNDSIKIIYGRCSAHYNRAIDDLWYFNKVISINEWTESLSELGIEKIKN